MARLIVIFVTLFLVAIPAKADVTLWPRPVPGWTVIQVYGVITPHNPPNFERYTENVDPTATLVIVTGPGGNLVAGISMGLRARLKKLIVGVMGNFASSCDSIRIVRRPAFLPIVLMPMVAQPQLLRANPLSPPSGSYELTARLGIAASRALGPRQNRDYLFVQFPRPPRFRCLW